MLRIILVAVVLLVASCATIDTRSPEEIVGERALAQSEALVAQDFDTALSYTVPSYRQGPRAAFYQANHSGSGYWTRTEVRWVQCEDGPEAERCSVRIWTYGSPPFSGRFVSNRGDSAPSRWDSIWVKIDGQWYQYLSRVNFYKARVFFQFSGIFTMVSRYFYCKCDDVAYTGLVERVVALIRLFLGI